MEENKRLLNVLSKKSLSMRSRGASEDEELVLGLKTFRQTMQDPVFQNLALGQSEWVNIQTVIRNALKTLHHGLGLQNDCLGIVIRNSLTKSNEDELLEKIGQKADAEELKKLFALLSERVQTKADQRDLEALEGGLVAKSAFIEHQKSQSKKIFEVETSILSRVAAKDFDAQRESVAADFAALRSQIKNLQGDLDEVRSRLAAQDAWNEACDRRAKNGEAILKDLKPVLKNCVSKVELAEALKDKVECVR